MGLILQSDNMEIPTNLEVNPELKKILGTICFRAVALADFLRREGEDVPRNAESEQAAVIHFLLEAYVKWGAAEWEAKLQEWINGKRRAQHEKAKQALTDHCKKEIVDLGLTPPSGWPASESDLPSPPPAPAPSDPGP